jgi:hypothetical protein
MKLIRITATGLVYTVLVAFYMAFIGTSLVFLWREIAG